MAVKQIAAPSKRHSSLVKILINTSCIIFLSWLMLFFWSLWSYSCKGFEKTCLTIHQLNYQQNQIFSKFKNTFLVTYINKNLDTHFVKSISNTRKKWENLALESLQSVVDRQADINTDELNSGAQSLILQANRIWFLIKETGNILLVKLAILISGLPLFGLAMLAGLVDGLSQRSIRTASLGRESTYMFHKLILLAQNVLIAGLGLWLALPLVVSPSPIFLSLSVFLGLVVSMSASRFKKYL